MQKHEILAIVIYLLFPFIGLVIFLWLRKKMKNEKIPNPPALAFFIIFFNYGGILLVVLTNYFLGWPETATLGVLYLWIVAPILMLTIACYFYRDRKISVYHKSVYLAGALYFIIAPLVFAIL